MKVDIKKQFQGRSYRVKGIDLHPTEPWVLCSLFTGSVQIWNYDTQTLLRTLEVSAMPVRACRFIARKNWLVVGGDDAQIRVFNYNTLEKVTQFEAHHDYIRSLAVHPTLPFLLSAGDDAAIHLWNWDENWRRQMTYTGHTSYVMYIAINMKDPNTFASACMDRTVKVWSFSSPTPNFTLMAHDTKGVNFVEYYPFGDKPYLITTSDDQSIRIFDYQSKSAVATLTGHSHNVSFAVFHPELPIIISGSEDSTLKIWNARSYKLEQTLNYGLERAWCVSTRPNSSLVAVGFETGNLVLRFGNDTPAVSMDNSGKLVWAKHLEAFSSTIKPRGADEEIGEDEVALPLVIKELGTIEVHPTQLVHSPNGRFVAVVGDGEYIIYTALAWRNKTFGQAVDFAWAQDSTEYAIRLDDNTVRAFKNFTERPASHLEMIDFPVTKIFGGTLLGAAGDEFVAFYDWDSGKLVHTVDVEASEVLWSDSGELVAITTEDTVYVLRHDRSAFQQALADDALNEEEGAEGVFEVIHEVSEKIRNGKWIGDCFLFTTFSNRLNYLVGSEVYNISHFDKDMYLLGYLPRDNSVYLCDKDINVVSHKLSLAVLEYQTVVLRGDTEYAKELLQSVPQEELNGVARFLEAQGQADTALQVSQDPDHRFDLAVDLGMLDVAIDIARSQADDTNKWKVLGDKLLKAWRLTEAEECFSKAKDLDTLLLIYTSTANKKKLAELAERAVDLGSYNLAFNAFWYIGDVDSCADLLRKTGRKSEAALLSLTWGGNVNENVKQWKEDLLRKDRSVIADLICDPAAEPFRFPEKLGEKTYVRAQIGDADLIDVDELDEPAAGIAVASRTPRDELTTAMEKDADELVAAAEAVATETDQVVDNLATEAAADVAIAAVAEAIADASVVDEVEEKADDADA